MLVQKVTIDGLVRLDVNDVVTDIREFGADPAGVDDSGPAIQEAIDKSNGPVLFPPGDYSLQSPCHIDKPGVTFLGFSNPRALKHGSRLICEVPETQAAIQLLGDWHGFRMSGLNVFEKAASDAQRLNTLLEVNAGDKFRSGLTLERCAFWNAQRGIEFFQNDSMEWIGNVTLRDCNLTKNDQALACVGAKLSRLIVGDCEIRQNRGMDGPEERGCVAVQGNHLTFRDVNWEGQPRPLEVWESWSVRLRGGYYELNEGYFGSFLNVNGIWAKENYHRRRKDEPQYTPWLLQGCRQAELESPIVNTGSGS